MADSIAAMIDPLLASPAGLPTLAAWACAPRLHLPALLRFLGVQRHGGRAGPALRTPPAAELRIATYKARDPSDFWRRWHISSSSVLRDYLYIPMGGSRDGEVKTHRNIFITMLLGGLWHGAHWTFVAWGGYHALLLSLHRVFSKSWSRLPVAFQVTTTFLLAVIGWVLFRAESFGRARDQLVAMFHWRAGEPPSLWL